MTDKNVVVAQYHQGPIPNSAEMARYAQVDPSLPDRIMGLAERQSSHRQGLESKSVDYAHKRSLLGMVCSFVMVITALLIGAVCILNNKEIYGISAIITAIVPIVGAFIYTTISNRKERLRKWEEIKK